MVYFIASMEAYLRFLAELKLTSYASNAVYQNAVALVIFVIFASQKIKFTNPAQTVVASRG